MSSPAESTRSSSARASLAGANDVGQRAAVLLGETEQQVAATPHVVETRRIEVDRRLVVLELARQRLDGVVRRVVRLLQPRRAWDRCAESP